MSEWINGLVADLGYGGILLLMFLETVFPPIPSEVIMPVAGVAAARGDLDLAGIVAAGTTGAMAGNVVVLCRAPAGAGAGAAAGGALWTFPRLQRRGSGLGGRPVRSAWGKWVVCMPAG